MIHDPLDEAMNAQFELSYELLHFIRWLLEQESEHKTLKVIIKKALIAGLKNATVNAANKNNSEEIQQLQYGLIEFFALLDTLLYEAMHEETLQKVTQKKLKETIQQIDGKLCDDGTLHDTITKTTDELERFPEKSAKTILFETLIKQWRPTKENEIH